MSITGSSNIQYFITNIPVIEKAPVIGHKQQMLRIRVTMHDMIAKNYGIVIACIGHYFPGAQSDLFPIPDPDSYLIVADFIPHAMPPIAGTFSIPQLGTREFDTETKPEILTLIPSGIWDVLFLSWWVREGVEIDPDKLPAIMDHAGEVKATLIARNAFKLA